MAIPDKDHRLVGIDYAAVEKRILGHMASDQFFPRLATTTADADLPPPTADELYAKLKRVAAELPPRPPGMPSVFGSPYGSPTGRIGAPLGAMQIVVVNPPESRRRSWKARLFSRPWRPWQATEEGPQHPLWGMLDGDNAYRIGDTIYVSPAGYAALKVATKLGPIT